MSSVRSVELVFAAESPIGGGLQVSQITPEAAFVPLDQIRRLDVRPRIAGYLAELGSRSTAGVYLGNMWRPDDNDRGNRHQPGLVGEAAEDAMRRVRLGRPTPRLILALTALLRSW